MSTLKRKLKSLELYRRKSYSDIVDVFPALLSLRHLVLCMHGYRWMHLKCKQFRYNIPREVIYELMRLLDPNGVQKRTRGRLVRDSSDDNTKTRILNLSGTLMLTIN